MAEKKFRILATNGDWIKEVYYFTQGPRNDFYYGDVRAGVNDKTSYHVSGQIHVKSARQFMKWSGQPLSKFKGIHQLFSMGVGISVFSSTPYNKVHSVKKVNGTVIIDVRRYKEQFGITAFLLEPEQINVLNMFPRFLKKVQFTIFTETNPWLVIGVFENQP